MPLNRRQTVDEHSVGDRILSDSMGRGICNRLASSLLHSTISRQKQATTVKLGWEQRASSIIGSPDSQLAVQTGGHRGNLRRGEVVPHYQPQKIRIHHDTDIGFNPQSLFRPRWSGLRALWHSPRNFLFGHLYRKVIHKGSRADSNGTVHSLRRISADTAEYCGSVLPQTAPRDR